MPSGGNVAYSQGQTITLHQGQHKGWDPGISAAARRNYSSLVQ